MLTIDGTTEYVILLEKTVSKYILVNYIFIFYFTEHPFKFQAER